MIELNLLEKKEPFKLPVVLGIDFNELNLLMLVVAMIIWYIPGMALNSYFEGMKVEDQKHIEDLQEKNAKIKSEIDKNGQVKETLKAYQDQVEKLKARSAQVDEILKIRTNPKKLLEKIAKSMPDEVWVDNIKINQAHDITITGGSFGSRGLGEFITVVNDTPYFSGSFTPTRQESKTELLDGVNTTYDTYELKGKVKSFDARTN